LLVGGRKHTNSFFTRVRNRNLYRLKEFMFTKGCNFWIVLLGLSISEYLSTIDLI